jgi:hypothetical protein
MRRKITAPAEPINAPDLPELPACDQQFVHLIVTGASAAEAFRMTRDVAHWTPASVWAEASRLRNAPKIVSWIASAMKAGMASTKITIERHVRELERLKELSVASGNMGAAVQCEQTIGKAAGLHIDRVQEVPLDPVQTLKDIAQTQPDLAAQLAAAAGIPWVNPDEQRTIN